MIQQISHSINSFFSVYWNPKINANLVLYKIKQVAAHIFLGFICAALYYFTPNLCYFGFLFGIFLGEQVHLRDMVIKVKKTWDRLKLEDKLLIIPAAYFAMPLCLMTSSFTAYACLGDNLVRIAGKKPNYSDYPLGWN